MYFVLGLLIVIISLYLIADPFLEEQPVTGTTTTNTKSNKADTKLDQDAKLRAIEDIEADYHMKKISKEDYDALKAEYEKDGVNK